MCMARPKKNDKPSRLERTTEAFERKMNERRERMQATANGICYKSALRCYVLTLGAFLKDAGLSTLNLQFKAQLFPLS
jgi:lipopolysaccharide export system protein LptA